MMCPFFFKVWRGHWIPGHQLIDLDKEVVSCCITGTLRLISFFLPFSMTPAFFSPAGRDPGGCFPAGLLDVEAYTQPPLPPPDGHGVGRGRFKLRQCPGARCLPGGVAEVCMRMSRT